ncbi:cytochrome P450 [Neorhodopirellula pilleata]|uniref:Epi-isozizaene 5-monooxygenase/(E)-beta-farnesene synthase n=1 Tax=Neorhodopirellula pilleata TaxID=2714738 RepID=A0A5C5ZKM3_9BACT|nr:cytochrome P450 [Neorhodopirellula pilleata]TWT87964.1 Epi-isozizaene 5-monooxygenase/(E)-beta-farnesene synthase [Neorhodopirellula pilleata]
MLTDADTSPKQATIKDTSWVGRLGQQISRTNPFGGDCQPSRVPVLFQSGRPCLPFPHPWNYHHPIEILETYFHGADDEDGAGRHNRYLDVPGFPPVLVSRDPGVIRAILTATGDRDGQFDRDPLPSTGIARATGEDTLLFGNGSSWRRQRKASASPFGKTALFQVEVFGEFEHTFRSTVRERLVALRNHLSGTGTTRVQLAMEPEIQALMLEMLVRCFFGTSIEYAALRDVYVPSLQRIIDHIVRDTVINQVGLRRSWLAPFSQRYAQANRDFETFEELTDLVLAARQTNSGMWKKFNVEAPDAALRSNIKVFLAGALEATTSYATWAISHLARNQSWQERVYEEVSLIDEFTPARLIGAKNLNAVLEETLRLTPSLYFLPRRANGTTRVETADGRTMDIPAKTHVLLDIWHANRHPDHWGEQPTGYSATVFEPQRWQTIADNKEKSKDFLHFGFGHGSRVCPGKHLGQLEVALVVGAFVKMFRFSAVRQDYEVKAGVSTKPADGTMLELELRAPSAGMPSTPPPPATCPVPH